MKNLFRIGCIALLFLTFSMCGGGASKVTFSEPVEDKALIIGNIFFFCNNWSDITELIRKEIQVAIVGLYTEDGKEKTFGAWTEVDSLGYYYYPNAPANGRYEIKAFRIYLQGKLAAFGKDFRYALESYKGFDPNLILFNGVLFEKVASNRIVNLRYAYFTLHPNGEIRDTYADIVTNLSLPTGQTIDAPLIFDYYLKQPQFKTSGWATFLEAEARKYR